MSSKWEESPDSLWEICLNYCVNKPSVFAAYDEERNVYTLRDGITFPPFVSESVLKARHENGYRLDDAFLYIFKDPVRTVLKHICLRDSDVTDAAFQWLMRHYPVELDISGCQRIVESETIDVINKHSSRLNSLLIGSSLRVLEDSAVRNNGKQTQNYIFNCPQLRVFSVHNLKRDVCETRDVIATILTPLCHLNCLDLSGCAVEVELMDCLETLHNLTALVLYNVFICSISDAFSIIAKLKNLR